jgi:hypothetical protein
MHATDIKTAMLKPCMHAPHHLMRNAKNRPPSPSPNATTCQPASAVPIPCLPTRRHNVMTTHAKRPLKKQNPPSLPQSTRSHDTEYRNLDGASLFGVGAPAPWLPAYGSASLVSPPSDACAAPSASPTGETSGIARLKASTDGLFAPSSSASFSSPSLAPAAAAAAAVSTPPPSPSTQLSPVDYLDHGNPPTAAG